MLAVVLVVLVAVVTVGIAARQATARRVERFLEEERALEKLPELGSIARSIATRHEADGWSGVDSLLREWRERDGSGWDLVVLAPDNRLLASSDPDLVGWSFSNPSRGEILATRGGERLQLKVPEAKIDAADGESLGTLVLFRQPREELEEMSSHQTVFVSSISRYVLYSVLAAGLAAVVLTWAATRRVLRPVEELTAAARRMEGGDLSQRVQIRSDDEIGRLGSAFNSMADSVERNQAALRNLVSDTAHELRTPITNLRCQLEALEDGLVELDAEALGSLAEDVALLQRLAEDLQVLALADAGGLRIETEACDLEREAQRAVRSVTAARTEPGAEISVELAGTPAVEADPQRLQQVFSNLLHNALEHTPPDGSVRVAARPVDGRVEISIEDDGEGIAAEHLPQIFDRFYRPDPSRQRATGGAGLGLAIVKQLVEAQNGEVSIESEPGRGTSVSFSLPMSS
jgi:signal transduction histidine kinase